MAAPRVLLLAAAAVSLLACDPSGPPEPGDAATASADAGSSGADAGASGLDAGGSEVDAGSSAPDAGEDAPDAGEEAPDAGEEEPDAGDEQPDAGDEQPDAGAEPDAGEPLPDGGELTRRCDDETRDVPGGFIDHEDGTRTDVTDLLLSGTPEAPAGLVLDDAALTLCEGTYFATVTATGTSSVEGRGEVTLDGAGTFRLVDQPEGGALTVRHVHLKDGAGEGGGLRCVTGEGAQATLLVEGVEASGGRGGQGAALWTSGCAVTIRDSHLHDNETTDSGGAIWATTGARVDLVDTRVRANASTGPGGGVLLVGSSGSCRRTAEDKVAAIHANTASDGGQVYLHTSTMELVDCDLGANGSPEDGVPNDILTWNLVETRHYQASAAANATCTNGVCGGQPTIWDATAGAWRALAVRAGMSSEVAFNPIRTGRIAGVFARVKLSLEGASCEARLIVESGGHSFRGELTPIQFIDTWVGVRTADLDMRAGGPRVTVRIVFEQCEAEVTYVDGLIATDFFSTWGDSPYQIPPFGNVGVHGQPWQIAWTPEL